MADTDSVSGVDPASFLSAELKKANEAMKNMPAPAKRKDEVNFDDISSDSEVSGDDDNKSKSSNTSVKSTKVEDLSIDQKLTRSEGCKISGNDSFKANDNREALRLYNKGLRALDYFSDSKPTLTSAEHREKWKELETSLLLNKAAVCNRLFLYKDAIKCSTEVITSNFKAFSPSENDNKNEASLVKALLRRAYAYKHTNDLEQAKTDLNRILKIDAKNADAIKELRTIKRLFDEMKERERNTFANIFNKGVNVYDDKEEERKKKAKEEQLKQKRLMDEYDLEKEEKEKKGETIGTFEDWEKERKKKKEEEQERKRKEKEKREREREERRRKEREEGISKDQSEDKSEDDSLDLDEEELAAIEDVKKKGYAYFKREKTEDEKTMLAHNKPSKLSSVDETEEFVADTLIKQNSVESVTSAWNNGQTWEERDISDNIKKELKDKLSLITIKTDIFEITTVEVDSISGECQIVFVSGKKGTVYDMSLTVKWKGLFNGKSEEMLMEIDGDDDTGGKEVEVSGKMNFAEIANGIKEHNFECEKTYKGMSKLTEGQRTVLSKALNEYESKVRENIFEVVEGQFAAK